QRDRRSASAADFVDALPRMTNNEAKVLTTPPFRSASRCALQSRRYPPFHPDCRTRELRCATDQSAPASTRAGDSAAVPEGPLALRGSPCQRLGEASCLRGQCRDAHRCGYVQWGDSLKE